MAAVTSLSASSMLPSLALHNSLRHIGLRKFVVPEYIKNATRVKSTRYQLGLKEGFCYQRLVVLAVTEGSAKSGQSDEKIPSWAKPGSVEPPPWARDEGNVSTSQPSIEIPYFAYLLASAITAIAAIGSIFEYINQRPVFGILNSDSLFYVPVLGFFAFTGIPTSAFLWFKSVQVANKQAEEQDKSDGYF